MRRRDDFKGGENIGDFRDFISFMKIYFIVWIFIMGYLTYKMILNIIT